MTEKKRTASFGIKITLFAEDSYMYEVFDKEGVIVHSNVFSTEKECRNAITRLRKVCKNRYTATKLINLTI